MHRLAGCKYLRKGTGTILVLSGISQVGPETYRRLIEALKDDSQTRVGIFTEDKKALLKPEGIENVAVEEILNW